MNAQVCYCACCKRRRREELAKAEAASPKQPPPPSLCKEYVLEKQFNVKRVNGDFV